MGSRLPNIVILAHWSTSRTPAGTGSEPDTSRTRTKAQPSVLPVPLRTAAVVWMHGCMHCCRSVGAVCGCMAVCTAAVVWMHGCMHCCRSVGAVCGCMGVCTAAGLWVHGCMHCCRSVDAWLYASMRVFECGWW